MLGVSKGNVSSLSALLNLPTKGGVRMSEIIVNCGGCTSLHHNN